MGLKNFSLQHTFFVAFKLLSGYHPYQQMTQVVICLQSKKKQQIMLQQKHSLLKEALRQLQFQG